MQKWILKDEFSGGSVTGDIQDIEEYLRTVFRSAPDSIQKGISDLIEKMSTGAPIHAEENFLGVSVSPAVRDKA